MPLFRFEIGSDVLIDQASHIQEIGTFSEAINVAVNAVAQFVGSKIPPPASLQISIYDENDALVAQVQNRFEITVSKRRLS